MMLGADAELLPAFEDGQEIPVSGRIAVVDPEQSPVGTRFGLILDPGVTPQVVSLAAVLQRIVRPEHEHAKTGQIIQGKRHLGGPVSIRTECPLNVEQLFPEEVFDRHADRAFHIGFGGDDPQPAVDPVLGGEEIVRGGGDQAAFRGRRLKSGHLSAFFDLDGIDPERTFVLLVAAEETDIDERGVGTDLEDRLIPLPFCSGNREDPFPDILVHPMEVRDPDMEHHGPVGFAAGVETQGVNPGFQHHLERPEVRVPDGSDACLADIHPEGVPSVVSGRIIELERFDLALQGIPAMAVESGKRGMPAVQSAFERGIGDQILVADIRQDQVLLLPEIHPAADIFGRTVHPLPEIQGELVERGLALRIAETELEILTFFPVDQIRIPDFPMG